MKIGYARVSTDLQDLGKQVDALTVAGCEKIFRDTISGAKASRPELDRLLSEIQSGDTLVICKLDRFARSMRHLCEVVGALQDRKIGFMSLQDNFDLTTANGRLLFNVLGSFAEFERDLIRARTTETLAHLRAQGVQLGRRVDPASKQAMDLIRIGKGRKEVMAETGVTRSTYYRLVRVLGVSDLPL